MSTVTTRRRRRVNKKEEEEQQENIDIKDLEESIQDLDFNKYSVEKYLQKYKNCEQVIKKRENEIIDYKKKFESILNSSNTNNIQDITFNDGINKLTEILNTLESIDSKNPNFGEILQMYTLAREIMTSLEEKTKDAELKLVQVN